MLEITNNLKQDQRDLRKQMKVYEYNLVD